MAHYGVLAGEPRVSEADALVHIGSAQGCPISSSRFAASRCAESAYLGCGVYHGRNREEAMPANARLIRDAPGADREMIVCGNAQRVWSL